MTINSGIECRHCKYDSEKRVVLVRKPLISNPLQLPEGYQEFYCNNKIKVFRSFGRDENRDKIFKWFEEICENHILVKNNIIRRSKKMAIKCRNCKDPIIDDSKSCLNNLGFFCSKECSVQFREKHPIDYNNQVGISSLF